MVSACSPGTDGKANRTFGNSGAAIFIALAAALIVMLAAGILFSLMDRMISGQLQRERDAQVALSETSALEALVIKVEREGLLETGSSHSYELADVTTVFTVSGSEQVGPRTAGYSTGGDAVPLVVPAGRLLFAVTPENGLTVYVYEGSSAERIGVFRTELSPSLVKGCAGTWNGAEAALLVLDTFDGRKIAVVTNEGFVHTTDASIEGFNPYSVLSFGNSDGTLLLAISNGANLGTLVDIDTGASLKLISPFGTCPAVMPSGEVYGNPGTPNSFTLAPPVREVFFGDFNRDGRDDIAWAGPRSLYTLTSTGLCSASPSRDAALAAWGSIEGSLGLGAKWTLSGGESIWTRLNHDGFGVFQPTGALTEPWTGRFFGRGTLMTGVMSDSVMMASLNGGRRLPVLSGGGYVWGDADGGDVDVFAPGEGGFDAVFNPLAGDGTAQILETASTSRNETSFSSYRIHIYGAPPACRVFTEREGPGEQ
ncbi:MAG: hypothetical protein R6V62_03915 [Candidatus Fermentibacteraceae bacterium]